MNLLGVPRERGCQLYFRDDGPFHFRMLDIDDASLVAKTQSGEASMAWQLHYKLLKQFVGFKKIAANMVTISFGRDIVLDIFSQLKDHEKPEKGEKRVKTFVTRIAEAKCYQHEKSQQGLLFMDKMTIFLGLTMVLLAIGMGIKASLGDG